MKPMYIFLLLAAATVRAAQTPASQVSAAVAAVRAMAGQAPATAEDDIRFGQTSIDKSSVPHRATTAQHISPPPGKGFIPTLDMSALTFPQSTQQGSVRVAFRNDCKGTMELAVAAHINGQWYSRAGIRLGPKASIEQVTDAGKSYVLNARSSIQDGPVFEGETCFMALGETWCGKLDDTGHNKDIRVQIQCP